MKRKAESRRCNRRDMVNLATGATRQIHSEGAQHTAGKRKRKRGLVIELYTLRCLENTGVGDVVGLAQRHFRDNGCPSATIGMVHWRFEV